MLTLLVVLTSASPVATGLEISSTGSLPPHERSHRNRSHALHRAQRRHPRHGFSCGPTFFQLRSPAAATPSFCSQRRPVRVVRRSPVNSHEFDLMMVTQQVMTRFLRLCWLGSRLCRRFSGRKLSESYLVVEHLGRTPQYLS